MPLVDSELGPIPEGWQAHKLSEIVETQYGYTASAQEAPVGPKYLRGMDINKTSYIEWDRVPYCPIGDNDYRSYRLAPGDIVVIRMADPGKAGIVEKDIDAVFASYLIRLKPWLATLSWYHLFYYLSSDAYQNYVNGASTGATRRVLALVYSPMYYCHCQQIISCCVLRKKRWSLRQLMSNLLDQNANLRRTRDLLLPRLISGRTRCS